MKTLSAFALIEVMVVLAVLGILLAVIVPDYQQYQLRSYRLEARLELYRLAELQQQYYLQHRQYAAELSAFAGLSNSYLTTNGRFRMLVSLLPDGYLLQAEAVGAQQKDEQCRRFSLDHRNQQHSEPTTDCWQ